MKNVLGTDADFIPLKLQLYQTQLVANTTRDKITDVKVMVITEYQSFTILVYITVHTTLYRS